MATIYDLTYDFDYHCFGAGGRVTSHPASSIQLRNHCRWSCCQERIVVVHDIVLMHQFVTQLIRARPACLARMALTHSLRPCTAAMAQDGGSNKSVIIIGAGFSGLSAAHRLVQACPELQVLVVEAGGSVGGRCKRGVVRAVGVLTHIGIYTRIDAGGVVCLVLLLRMLLGRRTAHGHHCCHSACSMHLDASACELPPTAPSPAMSALPLLRSCRYRGQWSWAPPGFMAPSTTPCLTWPWILA